MRSIVTWVPTVSLAAAMAEPHLELSMTSARGTQNTSAVALRRMYRLTPPISCATSVSSATTLPWSGVNNMVVTKSC